MRFFIARRGVALATGSRPRMLPGFVQGGRRAVAGGDALSAAGAHVSLLPLRAAR
ncbi:hypothetical protein ACFXPN_12755 [Streptomyces griseorubiginosus]|uniref:hypothetical protein n=1 Tax=Streptomyces griseorubiginosus TaxID=67304 RepID=UPI00368A8FD3